MSYITLEKDADGILELIMDQPGEKVNTLGDEFIEAMTVAVNEIAAQKDDIKGVYIMLNIIRGIANFRTFLTIKFNVPYFRNDEKAK